MTQAKFTHLLKPDAELMGQYLASITGEYSHIDYDVHVGDGRDPGPEFDPTIRAMAIQLSQRRIDAVAHAPNHIDIIEITLDAGITALGQLMVYPALYTVAFRPTKPLRPVLITRKFSPDVEKSYIDMGITTFVFPE